MKKWWVFVLLALIIVSVGVFYVWNLPKNQSNNLLPRELNEDFDPTVNEPRFSVLSFDEARGRLQVEYSFPPSLAGKRLQTTLVCEKGVNVREQGQTEPRHVELAYALGQIVPEHMPILLAAKCQDRYCGKMVGECFIYLN